MTHLWRVPREWAGEPAVILGGGQSLRRVDVDALRGRFRVLAINNAYRIAPWADALYFNDRKWLGWHRQELHRFRGSHIVSQSAVGNLFASAPELARLPFRRVGPTTKAGLSRNPSLLAGWCGGSRSLNLAYLFGADPIILVGFDLRGRNWHEDHRRPPHDDAYYRERFIPYFERMAPELAAAGVSVVNATPGSALTCFPMVDSVTVGLLAKGLE